jgi:hypothetical protein
MIPVPGDTNFGSPITADDLREHYVALTIQTEPQTTQEIIDQINAFNQGNWHEWNLPGPNCTTVVRDLLKAVGVLPRDFGSISPAGFWASLYAKSGNPSTMTYQYYGKMAVRQLNIPSKTGVDYGSPRYGMDVFDYMKLRLRPPAMKACVTVTDGATGTTSTECQY